LEIDKLRSLAVVANEGGFARAAPTLFISASALSRRIAFLEAEVGFQLLERTSQGVQLTALGEQFLERAKVVLDAHEELQRFVAERTEEGVVLRVGIGPGMAPLIRRRVLVMLRDAHPSARVQVVPGLNTALIHQLNEHRLDLALTHQSPQSSELEYAEILTEQVGIALSTDNPISVKSPLRLADLANTPFLASSQLISSTPDFYAGLRTLFAEAGINKYTDVGAPDSYVLREHVAGGNGFAIAGETAPGSPDGYVWDESVTLVRPIDFDYQLRSYIVWNRNSAPNGILRSDTVRELVAALIADGSDSPAAFARVALPMRPTQSSGA
jgi:DNA-binding transcriptional LysR family regulator